MPRPSTERERGPTKGDEPSSKSIHDWLNDVFHPHQNESITLLKEILSLTKTIKEKVQNMPENVAELKAAFDSVAAQVTEIGNNLVAAGQKEDEAFAEITQLISDLQTNAKIPADAKASFDDIVTKLSALQASSAAGLETARKLADIVPNPPTP